jgi:hypothetical protein
LKNDPRDPRAVAAGDFALAILSKRDLLQTLYYATKTNAAEAFALHRRLNMVQEAPAGGAYAVAPGKMMLPRHQLMNAKTAAESTAQDSAWAFFLIADYSLQRFRAAVPGINTREIGPNIRNGVKLNAAIWALANQARHLHSWLSCDDVTLGAKAESGIIRQLGYDPRDPNASREFLCWIPVAGYVDIEDMLLASARSAVNSFGWDLYNVFNVFAPVSYTLEKLRRAKKH